MSRYTPVEIFEFAVRIEENGEKFYRELAVFTQDPQLRGIFTYLADEEAIHRTTFARIAAELENAADAHAYPPEWLAYLGAFVDHVIFNKQKMGMEKQSATDIHSALETAIATELESVLYYQELKAAVAPDKQHLILHIIDEERKHFVKLAELKKNLK